jgi:diguanylate cyclase (GGDEF)-like protein/hemerythrin-like metal-binding protein
MTAVSEILIVDDDPIGIRILRKALAGMGNVRVATSGAQAVELAAQAPVDLVLLDILMPEMDGFETCRTLLQEHPDLPIVFLTMADQPDIEVRALEVGGRDFIGKPINTPVVRARVALHLKLAAESTERQRRERELEQARTALLAANVQADMANRALQAANRELRVLASTDALTGAWNRRRLEESVIVEMDRFERYGNPLSMALVDIDWFKQVNDAHGHAAGDRVLERLAELLRASLRATDSLTRFGGEEFLVLAPHETLSTLATAAERWRKTIAETDFPFAGRLTVSIGVAECLPRETWEQWFKRADAALYRAKVDGRNRVRIASETRVQAQSGQPLAAGPGLAELHWRRTFECGHPVIDHQHRDLFDDANRVLAAVLSAQSADEVAGLISTLIGNVRQHFEDEEAIIASTGYPDVSAHAAIHRALVDKADTLSGRFRDGHIRIGEWFEFLAYDLIAKHVLGSDREFFPYLRDWVASPR